MRLKGFNGVKVDTASLADNVFLGLDFVNVKHVPIVKPQFAFSAVRMALVLVLVEFLLGTESGWTVNDGAWKGFFLFGGSKGGVFGIVPFILDYCHFFPSGSLGFCDTCAAFEPCLLL